MIREKLIEGVRHIATPRRLRALGLAMAVSLSAACDELSKEQIANRNYVPRNVEFVDSSGEGTGSDMTATLNKWIADHPEKRILGIAGILRYRERLAGVEVISTSGESEDAKCELVQSWNPNEWGEGGAGAFGTEAVQAWYDQHPDRRVFGFTSIPHYSGGTDGYIICSELSES